MRLFYGKANCVECHSGPLLTDLDFHAIAMPQLGPGKGVGEGGDEDFGRGSISGNPDDDFKLRAPTLRNIALTAPYGHSGAFDTLEVIVGHHLDPVRSLKNYDRANFIAPLREDLETVDLYVMDSPELVQKIADANELKRNRRISNHDVRDIIVFLHTLTDTSTIDLRNNVPSLVPSGLPIYE